MGGIKSGAEEWENGSQISHVWESGTVPKLSLNFPFLSGHFADPLSRTLTKLKS